MTESKPVLGKQISIAVKPASVLSVVEIGGRKVHPSSATLYLVAGHPSKLVLEFSGVEGYVSGQIADLRAVLDVAGAYQPELQPERTR